MRKPNTSGRSRNNKDSSKRSDSKGKPFKKSFGDGFKKSDSKAAPGNRFGRKPPGDRSERNDRDQTAPSSRGGYKRSSRPDEGNSRNKPFKKSFGDGFKKPGFQSSSPSGRFGRKPPEDRSDRNDKDRRSPRTDSGSGASSYGPRKTRSFDKNTPNAGRQSKPPGEGKPFKKRDFSEKPFEKRPRKDFSTDKQSSGDAGKSAKFDRGGLKRGGKSLSGTPAPVAENPKIQQGQVRLNKFIANSGVCSRREADELISMGLISVNGKVITTLGYKVNPGDEVRHESKVLKAEKPVYILLNKPKGFLTTTVDPQERNTVMQLVGNFVKERVYPVGRLDRNTTGLLLLTNDGDLAEKLMHPSYNVKKVYKIELDKPLTKADATRILEGVNLEEGRAAVDDLAIISDDRKTVGLEIHIGWNRVVRRIFESLDYQVVKLDRSLYAGLTKKDLGRGEWRFLTKEELVLLKHFK